jgi:leader peptidase (prepilin peptidase) / N-methyltransferase
MLFTIIAFLIGLCAGSCATTAIERLPYDDEFHYQIFAGEDDMEPPAWWMRIPFIWFLVKPPEGHMVRWYDKVPLLPHFIYSWKFSNFRKILPPSHCRICQKKLTLGQRLPLVSFFLQGGRCGNPECRAKIPGRHVVVELSTGLLFALFGARFGPSWLFVGDAFLLTLFVIGSVIDWRYQIIPDEVNSLGLVVGLLYVAVTYLGHGAGILRDNWMPARLGGDFPYDYSWFTPENALLGILAGAGSLYLFAEIGGMIARTDAMGGGDVKLAGFIGVFVGWQGVLTTLFYSALIAAPCGVLLLVLGKGKKEAGFTKFAFGPYLAMGAGLVLYHGHSRLINYYLTINQVVVSWIAGQMP